MVSSTNGYATPLISKKAPKSVTCHQVLNAPRVVKTNCRVLFFKVKRRQCFATTLFSFPLSSGITSYNKVKDDIILCLRGEKGQTKNAEQKNWDNAWNALVFSRMRIKSKSFRVFKSVLLFMSTFRE